MTKQEFIQAATLKLLPQEYGESVDYIADYVKNLADAVYEVCDKDAEPSDAFRPSPTVSDPSKEPIQTLLTEVGRVEGLHVAERKLRSYGYAQKGGIDVRLTNAFRAEEINTVGDLLRLGSRSFLKLRNVGPHSLKFVSEALKNLYNIENW